MARDFARVFNVNRKHTGYIDNDEYIITWCVGHLVEMVYPEQYDIKYKKWRLEDLPFLPAEYKYDVIKNVKEQYRLVNGFLNAPEVDVVYWAGDSGKEGQTIEENIRHFGGVRPGMKELRVWIDSQTDDEIRRGIAEARPMSDYANLGRSGVMRAIEDYALGINFSRALSVKYGTMINKAAATRSYTAIAVGRVMTCVLGMVVNREREIRDFVEIPFYRVLAGFAGGIEAEWHADEKSRYGGSPVLYKDNGFREEKDAKALIAYLKEEGNTATAHDDGTRQDTDPGVYGQSTEPGTGIVESVERSKSKKKPPFLFNLAELQAECSKLFKLSPDETLNVAQVLYERKMTTYPRSDARVLTTAVAKEITKNLNGLKGFAPVSAAAERILSEGLYKGIGKSQYTDDSKVTDHYAIIPTGVTGGYGGLNEVQKKVYELIVRRFLSIFYPPAEYLQIKISIRIKTELFSSSVRLLTAPGYLEIAGKGRGDREGSDMSAGGQSSRNVNVSGSAEDEGDAGQTSVKQAVIDALSKLKKGSAVVPAGYEIKPGRTSPPKRYTSGTMILAMENAGNLIDDEELRAQIRNTGIGTSATRAEIIKKLVNIGYLNLSKKTQVLTPGGIGEMVYEVVKLTEPSLLNPQMSASWEKGLDEITNGIVDVKDYRARLEDYIRRGTLNIAGRDLSVQIAGEIEKLTGSSDLAAMPGRKPGIPCPVCGGELVTTSFGYGCANYRKKDKPCGFCIGRIAGVRIDEEDIRELVQQGRTRKLQGFKSKTGRSFDAALKLEKNEKGECKVVFDFADDRTQDRNNTGQTRVVSAGDMHGIGSTQSDAIPEDKSHDERQLSIEAMRCPICGGRMKKTDSGYACENYRRDGNGKGSDDAGSRDDSRGDSSRDSSHGGTSGSEGSGNSGDSRGSTSGSESSGNSGSCGDSNDNSCNSSNDNSSNTSGGADGACIFSVGSIMGRKLSENDICELITGGVTPVIRGFVTDKGETFDARIGFKRAENGSITGMRFIRA